MNENIKPTFEQEQDPEFAKKLAYEEMKNFDIDEYAKWYRSNLKFFENNYDKFLEKLKEVYPEYYHYIKNIDDDNVKHIDSFTDGIDLLVAMKESLNSGNAVLILSYQRKYVDDTVVKIKEMLNINN